MKQSKNSNATDHTSDPSNALHTVPFPFLPFFSDQAAVSDALGWGRQRSKPAASPPRRWGSRQVATPPASRDATHIASTRGSSWPRERWRARVGAGAPTSLDGYLAEGKSHRPPKELRAAAMAGNSGRLLWDPG